MMTVERAKQLMQRWLVSDDALTAFTPLEQALLVLVADLVKQQEGGK